jgi:hypothetical protein
MMVSYETSLGESVLFPAGTFTQNLVIMALSELGWSADIKAALQQTMPEATAEQAIKEMAATRSDPGLLLPALESGKFSLESPETLSGEDWEEVETWVTTEVDPLTNKTYWDNGKLGRNSGKRAEAYAAEAAAKLLRNQDYRVLYVGRNRPIPLQTPNNLGRDGITRKEKVLDPGPDIVAIKDDRLAIIEVKGSVDRVSMSSGTFASQLGGKSGDYYSQPSLEWLIQGNRNRNWLATMQAAQDPEIREAARYLREVMIDKSRSYDAILIGFGYEGTSAGSLDQSFTRTVPPKAGVRRTFDSALEQIDPRWPNDESGARYMKAYPIKPPPAGIIEPIP